MHSETLSELDTSRLQMHPPCVQAPAVQKKASAPSPLNLPLEHGRRRWGNTSARGELETASHQRIVESILKQLELDRGHFHSPANNGAVGEHGAARIYAQGKRVRLEVSCDATYKLLKLQVTPEGYLGS